MNSFKYFLIFIFSFLAAVTVAQVPLFPYPPNDGTISYYVKGANDVDIFVDEKGDPTKTTLLFSSGFLTSRVSWDPQWFDPELYKKFHLVRYDYRGMGRSGKPNYPNSHSLDLFSDDLSAVINELHSNYDFKKKKIILIGWSIGTPVSINFMKRHPNVVIDGLISVCGLVNNSDVLDNTLAPYFPDIVDSKENFPKVVHGLNVVFNYSSFKPLSDEVRSIFLGNNVVAPLEYRRAILIPFDLSAFFSTLTIPILHIIGEKDIFVKFEHSLHFVSLGKNSEPVIYKEIGHVPLWENIKEFNKDIIKYASKI